MNVLDELIFIINKHLDVDLCELSRKHPIPWAKTFYAVLAHRYTDYDPDQIMSKIGQHRSTFYPKTRYHHDKFGLDTEYTDLFKALLLKTHYLEQVFKKQREEEKKGVTLVQSELQKLRYLAKELKVKNQAIRFSKLKQMREVIDTLEELELQRIDNEQ